MTIRLNDDTVSANQHRAARMGRIILRREPTADEVQQWTAIVGNTGAATLIDTLLGLDEVASLDESARVARAWDAAFGRYDPRPPASVAHWRQQIALGDETLASLPARFVSIAATGYRYDPCAAPVSDENALYAVRDSNGLPLIFTVGENRHLYLFRRDSAGLWHQLDLSAALPDPVHGHVLGVDVQQAASGTIALAVALGPRRGNGQSVVYVATGLSNALDDAGWLDAARTMHARTGIPAGAIVSRVAFAPLDGSGSTLVLVGAAVLGITNTYYFDVAAPDGSWTLLRIPEDADSVLQYALGRYRRSGLWTLYRVGPDIALTFTTFPDQYGKTINLSYTGLPAHATSFYPVAGTQAGLPDVYAAGDGIVVYRGGHDYPESVAPQVAGARLVWAGRTAAAEHLAFVDATQQLRVVSRDSSGAWSAPYTVSGLLEAAALLGDPTSVGLDVVAVTPSHALELRRIDQPGAAPASAEIPLYAVWEEDPLSAVELQTAIAAVGPVVYFDPDEEFFASSVEFFLSRVGLWNEIQGTWQIPKGSLLDPSTNDLSAAALVPFPRSDSGNPKRDSDYVLKIDDADYPALLPGHPDDAPFYVHAKFIPAENATDLVFWIFYPYNGAGVLKLETPGLDRRVDLAPLGVHEGDWEHFLIRVDNDTRRPVKLYLSAHDGGEWIDVSELSRDPATGRMVLYASRHGHATYNTPGDNLSHENEKTVLGQTVWDIALVNHCAQGQRINVWEPGRTQIIAAGFLGANAPAEPQWLQLPWRWGRYVDFTRSDIAGVIGKILGPVIGDLPIVTEVEDAVADRLIDKNVLGGEGNSAGPGAVKFKDGWFGGE
jgi:hypothetical protein